MKLKSLFFRFWPIIVIFFLVFVFFWKFFLKGLVPIPSDIIVGMYFPWLDYKWGFAVGVPVKSPLLSDVVSQLWILRNLAIDLFKSGQNPFWNPYSLAGSPLVPIFLSSFFSPFNILFFIFDNVKAMAFIIIFQPLLAMIFMYFLLKEFKLSSIPSIFGGVVFAFSGFMLNWLEYGNFGHTLLWLPFFILMTEKFNASRNKWYLLFLVVAQGISLSAGHLQMFFYSYLVWFFYFVIKVKFKFWWHSILFALCLLLIFISSFSYMIFPGAEALWFSIRTAENYISGNNFGFFPYLNLINFLAPDFFGNPTTGNWWGKVFNYQELTGYFGLVPLIFSFWWLTIKDKKTLFWKITFLLSFILAFKYPIGWLIYFLKIPLLSTASASRILSITSFSGAILAAFSLEKFAKSEIKLNFKIFSIFLGIFLGYATAIIISILLVNEYLSSGIVEASLKSISPFMLNMKVAIRNMILPFGVFTIFTFFTLIKQKFSKSILLRQVFLLVVLGLTVLELFRYGWKYNPFTKPELYFPSTPLTDYLQKSVFIDRIERERTALLPPNMWVPYRLFSASGYDPVYPLSYGKFLSLVSSGKPNFADVSRYGEIENYASPLYDLLGIKYALTVKTDEFSIPSLQGKPNYKFNLKKFTEKISFGSVAILENNNSFPRAFLVSELRVVENEKKSAEEIVKNLNDLKNIAIVESQENLTLPLSNNKSNHLSSVEFSTYNSGKVILNVESSQSSFLVLTDTYFSGWKAFIDNKETKIYKTDLSFRGIFMPEGKHEVVFVYQPLSFEIGKYISLGTLCLLMVILFLDHCLKLNINCLFKK